MNKKEMIEVDENIVANKIFIIRGHKVMLDSDLAVMYGVEVKRLNESVKRNRSRFPDDFMFQLNTAEWQHLKSQNATSSWGGRRTLPFCFTEQGVSMLSSVLNSEIAIQVNIRIIRVFTKMKQMLLDQKEVLLRIEKMEKDLTKHDKELEIVFDALKRMIAKPSKKKADAIGFPYPNKK